MDTKIPNSAGNDSGSNIFLTGIILFANLDYSGFADYAIKAAIGGAIWMTFRFISDYFSNKFKNTEK